MRRGLWLLLLLGAWQIGTNIALAQTAPVSDAEILRLIKERIEVQHRGIGIVFGVIDRSGSRIISYGQFAKGDPRPVNGDTVYEIGSITKVFTSLLLADMVQRGEVALDDPVSKYLPPQVKVPQHDGKSITLIDLSTHTSGLPRMPTNFAPANPANPFADYTLEQMYQFLSGYTLPRKVGSQFEYSNLGAALLGVALDRKARLDYESLVRARVTGPLGMSDTRIALTPGMQSRLAPGHDASLVPVPNWDVPAFAAAGALRSTANDLLKFIAAELGFSKSPLLPAMKAMLTVRRPTGANRADVALAWQVRTLNDKEIFWHNGGTGGYRTFIGFDPKAGVGVVGLSNVVGLQGVDDIGTHVLDPAAPVVTPPVEAAQIALDPKVLEGYVGNYQLAPGFFLAVTREAGQLYVQATNQGRDEIFASGEREFFSRRVNAQITFQADASGRASALVLHQNGRDMPAPRIEGDLPKPAEHKEIAVDAQLTFETDAAGKATKVTLHQNGRDMPAPRKQ